MSRRALTGVALAAVLAIAIPLAATQGTVRSRSLAVPTTTISTQPVYGGGGSEGTVGFGYTLGALPPSTKSASTSSQHSLSPDSPLASSSDAAAERIEETGTVKLVIHGGNVSPALESLTALATRDGGYVENYQGQGGSSTHGGLSSGTVVIDVPVARFNTLVSQVRGLGTPTSVVTNAQDVTGQYNDLAAQITALKASETQYEAILRRAGSISAVLAVQNQINNVESQIQQLEAEFATLSTETTYAALTVDVATVAAAHHRAHHSSGITNAVKDSVGGFVSGFEWVIRIIGPLLFALLVVAALALAGRAGWRRYRPYPH